MARTVLTTNRKDCTWILMLFIFLMQNCFNLVNVEAINVSGEFAYSDLWLAVFLLYFAGVTICYLPIKSKNTFGAIIVLLVVSCFIAATQQNYYTDQSFELGLRPQRRFIFILLAYFPVRKMSKRGNINWDKLLNYLMVWGAITAALYIIQKMLYPSVQFVYANMNYRNGSLRIYMDSTLIDLSVLIASYKFFKGLKIRHLFAAVIGLVYIAWVSQGRLEFISVVFGVGIGFLITRKLDRKKMLLWIALVVVLGVFLSSELGQYLVDSVISTQSNEENSMTIRLLGRKLYFEQLFSSVGSFLFGCGYPNSLYAAAMEKAGMNKGIYLVDNGIFGFWYVYGFLGVVLIVCLMGRALKMAWHLYQQKEDNVPIMYLGMICLMAYNIIFWYWNADGTFILVLMLCYIEQRYKQSIEEGR